MLNYFEKTCILNTNVGYMEGRGQLVKLEQINPTKFQLRLSFCAGSTFSTFQATSTYVYEGIIWLKLDIIKAFDSDLVQY